MYGENVKNVRIIVLNTICVLVQKQLCIGHQYILCKGLLIVAIINFAVFKNETAWAVGVHGCVREKSGQKNCVEKMKWLSNTNKNRLGRDV